MIAAWMVYATLTTALLALAAASIERLCRRHGCVTRWVWVAVMCLPLALPVVPIDRDPAAANIERSTATSRAATAASSPVSAPLKAVQHAATFSSAASLNRMLATAWVAASLVLLSWWIIASMRLRGRARRWRSGVIAGTQVLIADDAGPAVFGFTRPRIVAPGWLLDAERTVQCAAMRHEREHLAARDPQLLAFALALLVLTPWNIALWPVWRRLRLAVEVDCDARVLRGGEDAQRYGAALIEVAERRAAPGALAVAMHDSPSALEQRIALLFRSPPKRAGLGAAALALWATGFAVAAAQIEPPARSATAAHSSSRANGSLGRELLQSVQVGDLQAATQLLAAGANPDQVVLGDGSPLILAARRGELELVQLLLQHGAKVDLAVDGDGNPLIMAAGGGHQEIVAALLNMGADVNAVVIGDETPLIAAARGGHLDIVRTLVDRGADVSLAVRADATPWAKMRSPLSEARRGGHDAVIEYLRSKGAK